jgi:hypothetical protein
MANAKTASKLTPKLKLKHAPKSAPKKASSNKLVSFVKAALGSGKSAATTKQAPAPKGKAVAPAPAALPKKGAAAPAPAPVKGKGTKGAATGAKVEAPAPAPAKGARGKGKADPAAAAAQARASSVSAAMAKVKGTPAKSRAARAEESGDQVCREVACEGLATSGGYCRMHYIKNWKKIKRKELILKEGKLNQYIEELVAKYPDKYIEAIRQDLATDKDFAKVIYDLDLDESVDDFEVEGENVDQIIDTIKRDFDDEGEGF